MKRIIPILTVMVLVLSACSILGGNSVETPVSDAQMATRVAELLSTMTTPTTEIVFPPTPTITQIILPTVSVPTATPLVVITEIVTATPETTAEVTAEVTETTSTATGGEEVTPVPTVTATPSSSDPANNLGTPTGSDSLDSYSQWAWPTGSDQYLNVTFNNSKMEMTGLTTYAGWRLPSVGQQVNTYIELTVDSGKCVGKDSYGIIFRVPVIKEPNQGYLYEVTCDGYYRLWKWDGKVGEKGLATVLVAWENSSLINTGANQTNRLGVKIKDSTFTLFMNGTKLESGIDSSFDAGFFGVFVRSAESSQYTVKFDTLRYWELP